MPVDQINTIDIVGVDKTAGQIVLTITDHLEWDKDNEHLLLLQEKLNTYLAFVEGGQLLESYPEAESCRIQINVVCKYPPDHCAKIFFSKATRVVESAGIKLDYQVSCSD